MIRAGGIFEFCFESNNAVNDEGDNSPFFPYDSDGDNTYLDNIWFANQETIGLNEVEALQFEVSPNPTDAFIRIDGDLYGATRYEIYSILGEDVMQGKISQDNNLIDLSELSPNLYILRLGKGSYKILKTE